MRRVTLILFSSSVLIVLVTIVVLVLSENPKARVTAVQKCFEEMPNVQLTYISDLTKQASQSITAYVKVEGKGDIGFTSLSPGSFEHSDHVQLHGIGPYGFRTRELEHGGEYYGYAIDIGKGSPIPEARRLGITSVQSAVAHYDDLLALVAHWPVTTNEWPRTWPPRSGEWSKISPEEINFADLPRADYYFCLKRLQDASTEAPPGYRFADDGRSTNSP